jgi:hypothetical protein
VHLGVLHFFFCRDETLLLPSLKMKKDWLHYLTNTSHPGPVWNKGIENTGIGITGMKESWTRKTEERKTQQTNIRVYLEWRKRKLGNKRIDGM